MRVRKCSVAAELFSSLTIFISEGRLAEMVRQPYLVPPVHAVNPLDEYARCKKGLLITPWNEEANLLASRASGELCNGGAVEVVVAEANASLSQHKALLSAAR